MPTKEEMDDTFVYLEDPHNPGEYRYVTQRTIDSLNSALRSDDYRVWSSANTRLGIIRTMQDAGRALYPGGEHDLPASPSDRSQDSDGGGDRRDYQPTDDNGTDDVPPPEGMTIQHFTAENVLRLVFADFTPDDNMVVLTGQNGAGKSSVLNAIWLALTGKTASKQIDKPIRDGEEEARVELDLGHYIVTRTWRNGETSRLTVTTPDGHRVPTPQAILDNLLGAMVDPQAFIDAKPKDQLEKLLDVVDLGDVDLFALEAEYDQIYAERTDINREAKELRAQIDGMPFVPADTPDEEVSTRDLADEYAAAREAVDKHAQAIATTDTLERILDGKRERKRELEAQLEQLENEINADEATVSSERERLAAAELELPDPDEFKEKLDGVDGINSNVRAKQQVAKLENQYELFTAASKERTEQLDEIKKRKGDALATAEMPVEGLDVDIPNKAVLLNGQPFTQASSAEQIRAALGIAMAGNPELRVVFIRNGSLLDDNSMAIVQELTEAHGYQTFVERVADDNPAAIVIEAGQIVERGEAE